MEGSRHESAAALLVFELGDYTCAIRCDQIQEIVPMARTTRTPGQPPILQGFLNLRGKTMPVVWLRRLFGMEAAEPHIHTPVIVVRHGGRMLGLLVDRVNEVTTAEDASWHPLGSDHSLNECAESYFVLGDRQVVLLAPDRLLLREEEKRIRELEGWSQKRIEDLRGSDA